MVRHAYFISDHTGITAETFGRSLLTQFENIDLQHTTLPFIDNEDKARRVVTTINQIAESSHLKPLVFVTIVNPSLRKIVADCHGLVFDFFSAFIHSLEEELQQQPVYRIGRSHSVIDYHRYTERIKAIDFVLSHDDGLNTKNYQEAEIILVGVSRSGKTPTCLYLALQFGINAANYPFTDDDMEEGKLASALQVHQNKLFGLIIDATRLQEIRQERLPNSRYSSLEQCQRELNVLRHLFKENNIPYINTTVLSIEEIATRIFSMTNLTRRLV